jgi:hypothetical protein
VVLSPRTFQVVRVMPVDVTQCAGPQGMAIGPQFPVALVPEILLGCNAPSSVNGGILNGPQNAEIINAEFGNPVLNGVLFDQGGNDEVWFEPKSGHYFLAEGSHLPAEQVGVVDSLLGDAPSFQMPQIDPQSLNHEQLVQFPDSTGNPVNQQAIFIGFAGSTTRRAHSVAGWAGTVSGLGAITLIMAPIPAVGGTPAAFSSVLCDPIETSGCIAFFHSPTIKSPVDDFGTVPLPPS